MFSPKGQPPWHALMSAVACRGLVSRPQIPLHLVGTQHCSHCITQHEHVSRSLHQILKASGESDVPLCSYCFCCLQ